mmetsp:Transcript_12944/g.19601  ORF Transcript_12944/g.19601 Transcript_12944/m.19601 type:complete len:114 (+) Transcript_12944:91-432(+)|eukprot:CAMPEP_0194764256 /NCGR_PEP_ID=MMETSP0323_2-20130528/21892_1 /TAXON_ID=2866 ORGANISM="Crypthecodinium cohnii, Strain Seligo" /NCGR_SAMPLE_ID=MMETSP0323_2 /ASSEMBLY_ACC=CAM_ASM_000346 /LENGTH=113 /DNA_ID=CAMNT_0039690963 /DNA_START=74 /DNA_END=415 /DNA_ORIENTATION=+
MDALKEKTGAVKAKLSEEAHKPHTGPTGGLQDHVHEMKHVVHGEAGHNPVQNGHRSDGPFAQKVEHAVQGAKDRVEEHRQHHVAGNGSGNGGLQDKVNDVKASAEKKLHKAGA